MYCKDCGTKMESHETASTWEQAYFCTKCKLKCKVILGDYQGGSRDAYFYYKDVDSLPIKSISYHDVSDEYVTEEE